MNTNIWSSGRSGLYFFVTTKKAKAKRIAKLFRGRKACIEVIESKSRVLVKLYC